MREPPARALPPCTHAASAPTRTSDRRRIGTHRTEALPSGGNWLDGVAFGALGVLCFSGTAVATRVAVPAYGAVTLTGARFLIAAALAAIALGVMRSPPPGRDTLVGLLALGVGVAALYPLFLALAVERVPAYHAAVELALVPAATAVVAAGRHAERPPLRFWLACAVGVAALVTFALRQGGGSPRPADLLLAVAVVSCAIGYVEGARVARQIGSMAALCWSLVLLAPIVAAGLAAALLLDPPTAVKASAWGGLAYAGVVSMFVGSLAWYRGLASGGTARIGQLNLAQPVLAIAWSALLLGEQIGWAVAATAAVVLASMAVCLRTGQRQPDAEATPASSPTPLPASPADATRRCTRGRTRTAG
jgi:drug/metabolite transporter (DMT)-like permease